MKKFNLYEHNKKYMNIAKQASKGIYPSKRVARVGSICGGILGGVLLLIGVFGIFGGHTWGMSCLIAGGVTVASNIFNLKRLQSR